MSNMEAKSVLHIVGTECPSEMEDQFDKWYSDKHVPELLEFKGVNRVTRYRNLHNGEEYTKFLTIYEFGKREDFEAYFTSSIRANAAEDWGKIQNELGASLKWSVQFEMIKTWQR